MKKLTTSQVSIKLHITKMHVAHLLRTGKLSGEKLDPTTKNSPYLISEQSVMRYKNARKKPGKTAKTCEPCSHEPKKQCSSCKKSICLHDYRKTRHKMPAARCKTCENKRKTELRT